MFWKPQTISSRLEGYYEWGYNNTTIIAATQWEQLDMHIKFEKES